ncbi:MAG: isoleucine--tRNA ligase [Alphaproteobacteria bacterium]|nr:isoleucine--tRNA ligase [Alphaproteobacteria bacterium]
MGQDGRPYPEVDSNPSFPAIEKDILAFWQRERIFERSVENRPAVKNGASNEYVFYDGPPFANGLPHYGHLATGFVKDIVPRYHTMKGRRVERRFGWDCHGLPAELTSEKELGISGRQEILKFGVDKFNEHCRTSVMRFTQEWEDYVTRQGRWVDFQNDYKTMNLPFMESVIWAFKQLYDKGLVYEGHRVVPYSWAVQTPLSNFETRLDNSYRERQDPALTVGFLLEPAAGETVPTRLLAWTTTPWTLPSNMALAVNAELDYAVMEKDGQRVVLATTALERYERELGDWERVATVTGAQLAGRRYTPLFPYFTDLEGAFRVLTGDFVDASEGTGTVHIAPGFGEDDMELGNANGVPIVVPVDEAGNFTADVADYAGENVLEANKAIIRDLKAQPGVVLRHETYLHNYPHCWRTDTPLIYKAITAWYVKVSAFRDRMVELNKGISWIPEHIRDGLFGNWLENARDWNVSRNRFWGCPIPVWQSDDPAYPRLDVYGSLDEIERDFGVRPTDLHKPMVDELVRPNPDDPTGKAMMRRVPEVLDVWFDSGSMPFAQLHYPFENKERFEANFPADFIVEYVAQTRGWFYTLMVLSTALFDRAPFRTAVCHGVVLDENKQKLSKRLRNYPDPMEVFDDYGADALRWYMISSPLLSGGDLSIPREGSGIGQALRQAIIPIWNAYYFFTLYANIDGCRAQLRTDQKGVLDRYVLAKTRELIELIEARLDANDLPGAYAVVPGYIDALNNWYIRRSRARFWREADDADKRDAYDTLYTALTSVTRALAPLMPFIAERIYKNLTGEVSVHLADWPEATALPAERELVTRMDQVREICTAVMSLRETKSLRTRLPLKTLTVAHPDAAALEPYRALIADEVNVKQVVLATDPASMGEQQLKVNPQIGRRIGGKMKEVMAAQREGDWRMAAGGNVAIAGIELGPEDFSLRVVTPEGLDSEPFDGGAGVVVLDTRVYDDLEREGWARDFVRLVQQTRKDAGLEVTDRIRLAARVPENVAGALAEHRDHVCRETLAVDLRLGEDVPGGFRAEHKLSGAPVTIELARA